MQLVTEFLFSNHFFSVHEIHAEKKNHNEKLCSGFRKIVLGIFGQNFDVSFFYLIKTAIACASTRLESSYKICFVELSLFTPIHNVYTVNTHTHADLFDIYF